MIEAVERRTLGPYRILSVAGRGGMGVVYRALHAETGEQVALKTVATADARRLARIRCEMVALSGLRHPGIVRIVASGVEEGLPWYAMELLEGPSLRDFRAGLWAVDEDAPTEELDSAGRGAAAPTPRAAPRAERPEAANGRLREVLSLLHALCAPLSHLHARGIVHRDLKPENVLVRRDGRPVIVDFGLAGEVRGGVGREVLGDAGVVMGTAFYMAPEQVAAEAVDARADLYALGVILYELVTGLKPFRGRTTGDVIRQHLDAPPPVASDLVSGAPAGLDALLGRLLAKKPQHRLGYAEDVAEALRELGAEAGEPAPAEAAAYLYRPELAGRDALVAQLEAELAAARAGRGRIVLLGGESGVGKTTLAGEIGRRAALAGMAVVSGECQPASGSEPLHPFRTLLQAIADRCRERGAEESARLLGPRGRILAPYFPELSGLPGLEAFPEPPPLSADETRKRLLVALAESARAFALERACLLVLDDLQWADELSLRLLATLTAEDYERSPLLLLATYRTEEVTPGLSALLGRHPGRRVEVGRLDERAVGGLVAGMLALEEPPAGFVRFLARESEGNPFFAAEYLRSAVAEGRLLRRAGRWRVAESAGAEDWDSLPLPHTLRELVGRRLAGLGPAAGRLAGLASVVGREAEGGLLAAAAALTDREALEAIAELVARQVLEPGEGGGFRFVHDKLREVAYERLAPETLAERHRAVALALEAATPLAEERRRHAGELARHWERAGDLAKARDHYALAGETALRSGAHREAVASLERVLELDRSAAGPSLEPPLRARVERQLGEAFYGLGRFEPAARQIGSALRRLGCPVPEGGLRLAGALALEALRQLAQRPQAPGVAGERPDPAVSESMLAHYALAHVAFHTNRLGPYTLANLRMLNLAGRAGPSGELAEAWALTALIAGLVGWHGRAESYAARARETAELAGSPAARAAVLVITSVYGCGVGHWDRMRASTAEAAALAERIGDGRRWDEATCLAALVAYHTGDLEAAGRLWAQVAASSLNRQPRLWARCGLAEVALRRGGPGSAQQAVLSLEAAEKALHGEALVPADEIRVYGDLALARLGGGEPRPARRAAETAERLLRDHPGPSAFWTLEGIAGAAEALLGLLEERRAEGGADRRALLASARALVRGLGRQARVFPIGRPRASLCEGRLERLLERPARARRAFEAAAAGAERLGMPHERALAVSFLDPRRREP